MTNTMKNCIFCKIVKKELPCYHVYEDEEFLGFLDIFPRVKGHTILIPKKHYRWTYDVPNFGTYWEVTLKITKAMQKAMKPEFVTYVSYGLEVPHAHIHILPRMKGESAFVPETKQFKKKEFEEVAEKIRKEIGKIGK